jgi:hypothetical protein
MKKLVLMFVAFAAISFASCGNGNKPAENADSTATDTAAVVDTAATVDTATVDTAQAK